jgi:hypothetical protein
LGNRAVTASGRVFSLPWSLLAFKEMFWSLELQARSLFSKQNSQHAHIAVSSICQIFPTKSNSSDIA